MTENKFWQGYWKGMRDALRLSIPAGPSPFQLLDAAIRYAEPPERQALVNEWRKEYPLVELSKSQLPSLKTWGVEWGP
jgi:hypothetical protein